MSKILNFLTDNWMVLSPIVYELIVRLVPTTVNVSILDNVMKVIGILVKNRRIPSNNDTTDSRTFDKNIVSVDRTKHLLSLIFVLLSFASFGQVNSTFKSARSYHADSLTVRTEVTGLELMYDTVGALYYNVQHSPAKWRIFYGHAWHDLPTGSGGASVTASNGLTKVANDIQLGGTQTGDITITGAGHTYIESGQGLRQIYSPEFDVFSPSQQFTVTANGGEVHFDDNGTVTGSLRAYMTDSISFITRAGNANISALNGTAQILADNIVLATNTGDANITSNHNIDFTVANRFSLNGILAVTPATQFFRGDGTWAIPASNPAGSTTQIQYNNAGVFGAEAAFIYNPATNLQTVDNVNVNTVLNASPSGAGGGGLHVGLAGNQLSYNTGSTENNLSLSGSGGVSPGTAQYKHDALTVTGSFYGVDVSGTLQEVARDFDIHASGTGGSGNISISTGVSTGTLTLNGGGGADVKVTVTSGGGSYFIVTGLPTTCAGAPTGALANIAGVLNICP